MKENIFNDEHFFEEYKKIREKEVNFNNAIEQPAMQKLIPDLNGKKALDLGCGYGYNCIDFINRGVEKVLGIDIAEKMLDVAKSECAHPNIEYRLMSISDISKTDIKEMKFDFVYSSLAFHYVEDFKKLCEDIFYILNNEGVLLFSQESPFITASPKIGGYNRDENGNLISYTFSNYSACGPREENWLDTDYIKYHRTFGKIITDLAQSGFAVKEVCEPMPREEAVKKCPSMAGQFIRPNFLIVKAEKIKKGT